MVAIDSVTHIRQTTKPHVESPCKFDLFYPELDNFEIVVEEDRGNVFRAYCKVVLIFFEVPLRFLHVLKLRNFIQIHHVIRAVGKLIGGFVRNELP